MSILSAIQYNIPQEYIPDSQYRCTHHECPWSQYEEDTDFGFWKDGEERITSCQTCMERCNNDQSCGRIYQMGLSCMGTAPGGLLANVTKQQNSPPIQLIIYGHVKNSVS